MQTNRENPIETALADVTPDELNTLKRTCDEIRTQASSLVWARRSVAEQTRFCHWDGQSDDGRKHADQLGEDAKPFEGSSDARIRLADQLTDERVRLDVAAATRAIPSVVPVESNDAQASGKIATLLRWLIRNQWGREFRRQVKLLSQYRNGDSPGVGIALVDWWTETCLEYRDVTAMEFVAAAVEMGRAESDAVDVLTNPLRQDEALALLRDLYDIDDRQAKRALKQLLEGELAKIPTEYEKPGIPKFYALRAYQDVFYRENATCLSREPVILRRWLTEAEVLAEAESKDWNKDFTAEVLKHEGESAFDEEVAEKILTNGLLEDENKHRFEVLTAFYPATNEDGIKGIYTVTFSAFADMAAKPRELFDRKHGRTPFVVFARETLTERINDSRGIPELSVTDQNTLKLYTDSYADHVQISINPPVLRPRGRPFFKTSIAPFGEIEQDRPDQFKFMDSPDYPSAADKYLRERRRMLNEYWGRVDAETNPNETMATLAQQDSVDEFLTSLADVFQLCVQLCQQFMTDEQIARIVGGSGLPLARSVEEIQGKFDIGISFDVRDLDMASALEKPKMILENLSPFDQDGVLPRRQIILSALSRVMPELVDMIPPAEEASGRIVQAEKSNVVMVLSGTEPPMPEKIDAPKLRLQVFTDEMALRQQNPQAFPPISQAAAVIAQNRMKYLQQQATQMENAVIGRTGAAPVDLNAELAGTTPGGEA